MANDTETKLIMGPNFTDRKLPQGSYFDGTDWWNDGYRDRETPVGEQISVVEEINTAESIEQNKE